MFLFKKKEIRLDVFTYRPEVLEYYPVDYSRKFYPQWWKNIPNEYIAQDTFWPVSTIKRCAGFLDYYSNGVVIPLWCDVAIDTHPLHCQWKFSDDITTSVSHPSEQLGDFIDCNQYRHIKIESPWLFNCKEEISFVWTQPDWNFEQHAEFFIPPAVINYKYNMGTNINLFVDKREEKRYIISAGQPMVNIIPMSERKLKIHKHLLDKQEYDKKSSLSYASRFTNKYRNNKAILKSKESRCPFGFGSK